MYAVVRPCGAALSFAIMLQRLPVKLQLIGYRYICLCYYLQTSMCTFFTNLVRSKFPYKNRLVEISQKSYDNLVYERCPTWEPLCIECITSMGMYWRQWTRSQNQENSLLMEWYKFCIKWWRYSTILSLILPLNDYLCNAYFRSITIKAVCTCRRV